MSTILHTPSYESSLSRAERLALCSGRFSALILAPDAIGGLPPVNEVTGQPVFSPTWERRGTPSRAHAGVRGITCRDDAAEDDEEGEEGEESDLREAAAYKRRDSMREHSFRLPSQSSRRECLAEMRALGISMTGE